jgi:hypothetical protein
MIGNKTMLRPGGERWFWPAWAVAFAGFPIGGSAAFLLFGPIETVGLAVLGGAVAGAAIGAAQWLVLRQRLPLSVLWVPATAAGMAVGLTLGQVVLGDETTAAPMLLRGLITGAVIGAAQALLLRGLLPTPLIWAAVVTIAWPASWAVTTAIGVNLAEKWAVFGSSGALVFQLISGLTLVFLLRLSVRTQPPALARRPVAAAKGT